MRYIDPDGRDIKDKIRKTGKDIVRFLGLVELSQNGIWPTEEQGFAWDPNTRLYHTTFDCWQGTWFDGKIGYNGLYDSLFDLGTSMRAVSFEFSSGGTDYVLWGWKADYLNLGAGCEFGIYKRAKGLAGFLGHYVVDKGLAMDMSLRLKLADGTLIGEFDKYHWWPAIFNPAVQGQSADSLRVEVTINFGIRKQLYQDFRDRYYKDKRWSFNDTDLTATLNY